MMDCDIADLMAELAEVKDRQRQQDEELLRIKRGLSNIAGTLATAQTSIDAALNNIGDLIHGPAHRRN